MEIHPLDHPVLTWKHISVHMAIVVLGILIAISLEQSVEWLHHRHESDELIANNREECRKNFETTSNFLSYIAQQTALAEQWVDLLEAAPVQNGSVTVTVPSAFRPREAQALAGFARVHHVLPELAVLATAQQSQILQYLPTATAQYFNWCQGVDQWAQSSVRSSTEPKAEYDATMPGVALMGILPHSDAVRLSAANRDRAVQYLRTWIAKSEYTTFQYGRLNNYFHATADGALTEADLNRWIQQHADAH